MDEHSSNDHIVCEGIAYRTANNWYSVIPLGDFENRPIKYMEIGVLYGANLLSVLQSYAKHPQSQCIAIDPWVNYDDYEEYKDKDKDDELYKTFVKNIGRFQSSHKVKILRGMSNDMIPRTDDESFDIIYIDGNHNPEFVLEDAVLCFRKLKVGGYLIFDDFGWGGPNMTQQAIEAFVNCYIKRLTVVGMKQTQVFCKKTIGYHNPCKQIKKHVIL